MSFYSLDLNPSNISRTMTREQWKAVHRWLRVVRNELKGAEFELNANVAFQQMGAYGSALMMTRGEKITTLDAEGLWKGSERK